MWSLYVQINIEYTSYSACPIRSRELEEIVGFWGSGGKWKKGEEKEENGDGEEV